MSSAEIIDETSTAPVVPELILVRNEEVDSPAGRVAEIFAHGLGAVRAIGGLAIARHIENTPDYQSWKLTTAFVAVSITDWLDGRVSRWGRKQQNKDESERRVLNGYMDQIPDKIKIDSIMAAIGKRELENGNKVYGSAVLAAAGITITRDVAATVDRVVADVQGIDTRAQKSGKWKAFKQDVVTGLALTPLTKTKPGRAFVGSGFLYTAKESVKSGLELHKSFGSQREERKHQRA